MRRADSSNSMATAEAGLAEAGLAEAAETEVEEGRRRRRHRDRARQRNGRAHPSAGAARREVWRGPEALQHDADKNMLYLLQKEDSTKSKNASAPKQFVFDKVLWKDSVQEDRGTPRARAS